MTNLLNNLQLPYKYEDIVKIQSNINNSLTSKLNYNILVKQLKKNIIHIGQLKLFMGELTFLLTYYKPTAIVVYVGAAPGGHIPFLASLFPTIKFILYDPRDFDIENANKIMKLKTNKQIIVKQKLFTNKQAEKIKKKYNSEDILFISDIRSMNDQDQFQHYKEANNDFENWELNVDKNMKMQKKWCQIIQPFAASLKFRVLYNKPTYEYLTGNIILQIFNKLSIEARLFTQDYYTTTIYNQSEYEKYNLYYCKEFRNTNKNYEIFETELKKYNLQSIFDISLSCCILEKYYILLNDTQNIKEKSVKLFLDIVNSIHEIYGHVGYQKLFIDY